MPPNRPPVAPVNAIDHADHSTVGSAAPRKMAAMASAHAGTWIQIHRAARSAWRRRMNHCAAPKQIPAPAPASAAMSSTSMRPGSSCAAVGSWLINSDGVMPTIQPATASPAVTPIHSAAWRRGSRVRSTRHWNPASAVPSTTPTAANVARVRSRLPSDRGSPISVLIARAALVATPIPTSSPAVQATIQRR